MKRTMKYVKVNIIFANFLSISFCAPLNYYTKDAADRIRRVDAEGPKFWKALSIEEFEADDPPCRVMDEWGFGDALDAISFVAMSAKSYHWGYAEQTKENEQ